MKNIKKLARKCLIVMSMVITIPLIVGTIFYMLGDAWTWIDYTISWSFPATIFITVPLLMGMYHDDTIEFKLWGLGVKLLVITILYLCVIFGLVCEYSEPQGPDMEAYKNICIRIIPIVWFMGIVGHYVRKYMWNRTKNRKKASE